MMLAFFRQSLILFISNKNHCCKRFSTLRLGEKQQLLGRLYRGDEVENIVQGWMSVISTQEVTSQSAVCPTQPTKRHFFSMSDL